MRSASCCDFCFSLLSYLKRISPLILLALYSIFGGWLFCKLEGSGRRPDDINDTSINFNETLSVDQPPMETNWEKVYNELSDNLTTSYDRYRLRTHYENILRMNLTQNLFNLDRQYYGQVPDISIRQAWDYYDSRRYRPEKFVENVIRKRNITIKKYTEPMKPASEKENPWDDLWAATLFAATLYTTIGYGNIAPVTTAGRVAAMIYALFGIPMVLAILNECGQIMFNVLKALNGYYAMLRYRRRKWTPVNNNTNGPQEVTDLPLSAAIGLLVFWLCMSAGVFLLWEDWSYFTSFYFFFITLTTIGLGDVVPDYPAYTLMAFILVLFGLSVVSMSINIIQAKVENAFNAMIRNIDYEYRQKQINPEGSTMTEANFSGGMGVLQLWKNKPFKERLIMNLMGDERKKMLEQHWEQKARTKNTACQTDVRTVDMELQVDLDAEVKSKFGGTKSNKYIYNLADD